MPSCARSARLTSSRDFSRDAIRTFVLEPPDWTPIGHEISRLNSQECHVEELSAISDIVLASSDFIPVWRELDKLNDQIKDFAPESVDLSPITRAITRLNSQDTHQELPERPSETSRSSRQTDSGCSDELSPWIAVGTSLPCGALAESGV